jgi:hypothetical protein
MRVRMVPSRALQAEARDYILGVEGAPSLLQRREEKVVSRFSALADAREMRVRMVPSCALRA